MENLIISKKEIQKNNSLNENNLFGLVNVEAEHKLAATRYYYYYDT
jgi:hypothetical protein